MGYRMHQRTKSKIKWDSGIGNHQIEEWGVFFQEIDPYGHIYDEWGGYYDVWEIDAEAVEKEVKALRSQDNQDDVLFADWTIKEVADTLERMVNVNKKNAKNLDHPDIITLDWF